jgi:hypothetical protein
MTSDRSETEDLAAVHGELVRRLDEAWREWAGRTGVIPWSALLQIYRDAGQTELDAQGG